jgi:hypothetical protein
MIEDLLQCAAVQKVFQLRGAPLGVHGTVRRLPVFAVMRAPFALEPFRVSAAHPEFRLLQVNCFRARIQRALHAHAEEFSEVRSRRHVIHIAAVADLVPVPIRLRFVFVVYAIESPVQIILVIPPRDAGHHMNAIPAVPPRLEALG